MQYIPAAFKPQSIQSERGIYEEKNPVHPCVVCIGNRCIVPAVEACSVGKAFHIVHGVFSINVRLTASVALLNHRSTRWFTDGRDLVCVENITKRQSQALQPPTKKVGRASQMMILKTRHSQSSMNNR